MLSRLKIVVTCLIVVLISGSGQGSHLGIGGDADGMGEVPIAGCTCHAAQPDNSITIILDGIPFHYEPGKSYELKIQIIGGPEIDTASYTGGFSLMVSAGKLEAGSGFDELVRNWEEDPTKLTHSDAGSGTEDRTWLVTWTGPVAETGAVTFWLAGNSVNGDMAPSDLDRWNRLTTTVDEGTDDGRSRAVFSGNGDINPPAPTEGHADIHLMGAKLLAHWLGLLGFAAVFLVIIFCGFFLRYGFSRHYVGRSNLLRMRIKHLRRGDQI